MRIDFNTGATQGVESGAGNAAVTGKAAGEVAGQGAARGAGQAAAQVPAQQVAAQQDTAQFLFDRVKTQALAPESSPQIASGLLRIDALRKVLADGSYDVPPDAIAGAIVAEARV